jgi:hypothetical protein
LDEANALKVPTSIGAIGILLIAASCANPVDKAAKKRIFSPEDPPKVVASASEKIDAAALADKPELAQRVLRMGAAEATERLGPHRFNAALSFTWTSEGRVEELKEKRALAEGPGGVSGDFHASLENSRDQGLEIIRVHNSVFARSRYGKFRQRLRDRGTAEREREELYGAVRDFDSVFRGQLKLASVGPVSIRGRQAIKYAVSLAAQNQAPTSESSLPALVGPKAGIDESTARRIAFFENSKPKSAQGHVAVDAQTAVVLESRLEGMLGVPSPNGKEVAVRLALETGVSDIGKDPATKPPAEFLPDADKPAGIAAALERFGIPHRVAQGRDAGVEAEQGEEEP